MKNNFPQVLLLGNGINRAFSNDKVSLNNLLKEITKDDVKTEINNIPFPLQVILRTHDSIDESMKQISGDLYGTIDNDKQIKILRDILSMGFDNILTTNYSYELEAASLSENVNLNDYQIKKMMKHTPVVSKAESKFLLHTY